MDAEQWLQWQRCDPAEAVSSQGYFTSKEEPPLAASYNEGPFN